MNKRVIITFSLISVIILGIGLVSFSFQETIYNHSKKTTNNPISTPKTIENKTEEIESIIEDEDNNMSYNIYNYKKLNNIQNDKVPFSISYLVETSTGDLYFVDSTNQKVLLKTDDEGATVSIIETRARLIQGMYYDRSAEYIWFVDCANGVGDSRFTVWYLDLSDDSVNEVGEQLDTFVGIWAFDIVEISAGQIYVFGLDSVGILDYDFSIWRVDSAPFVLKAVLAETFPNLGDGNFGFMTVVGTDAYMLVEKIVNGVVLFKFDEIGNTLTQIQIVGANHELGNKNQKSIAYDGNDLLYYTVKDRGAGIIYLFIYSISLDTQTQKGEYNVGLMSDRQNDPTNPIPFNLEKGFDIALDADNRAKIYQISKGRGNIYAISRLSLSVNDLIVAVTDTYLFVDRTGSGGEAELWKYVDYITFFTGRSKITAQERKAWKADLWVKTTGDLDGDGDTDVFEIFDGLFLKIIGSMSSDSWDSILLAYFGSPDNFNDVDLTDDDWYFGLPDDFNLETAPKSITVAGDMAFIDTLTLPNDCTCEILSSFNNHNNVLKLTHDGGVSDPDFTHNYPNGNENAGTREFWWGQGDTFDQSEVRFRESTTLVQRLTIRIDFMQYWDGAAWQNIQAVVDNTLYHCKFVWRADNTWDFWVDEVKQVDNIALDINQVVGIDNLYVTYRTNSIGSVFLNAWGDPAQAGYAEGDNLTGRTRYGAVIPFVDDATFPIKTTIATSWQNHKQPLKLTHLADAEDPDFTHNITQITASTHEFYIGGTDTAEEMFMQFMEDATEIINLQIDGDNLYYESVAPAWVLIQAVADDTFYHVKVVWRADNTFDVYVDDTKQVDNVATRNNMTLGINIFYEQITDNNGCSYYLDAYGDIAQSNYHVRRNLVKTNENAIVYEGYVRWSDIQTPRKIWLDSPALFDLKNKTSGGSYSGRTDEIISDLLDAFANYITEGIMANGGAQGTVLLKGRKTLKSRINNYAQGDKFIYVIVPDNGQGLLNYNDGSIDSELDLTEIDRLGRFKAKKMRNIVNQATVKGAINQTTGVPFEYTADNLKSQQLYGIQPVYRTFANLETLALVTTQANAILDLEENAPFRYTFTKKIGEEGLVLPSEEITLSYAPKSVAEAQRIISKLEFYFRRGNCKWTVMDAVIYTSDMDLIKQDIEENTDLIEQISQVSLIIGETFLDTVAKIKFTPEGGIAIKLTNNTGVPSVYGEVVEADTVDDFSFKVCDGDCDHSVGAVYETGIADGEECWVVCALIAEVLLKDATASTKGFWVKTSDVAGRADATNANPPGGGVPELDDHMQEIGHCIESKGADTDVLAKIIMHYN